MRSELAEAIAPAGRWRDERSCSYIVNGSPWLVETQWLLLGLSSCVHRLSHAEGGLAVSDLNVDTAFLLQKMDVKAMRCMKRRMRLTRYWVRRHGRVGGTVTDATKGERPALHETEKVSESVEPSRAV